MIELNFKNASIAGLYAAYRFDLPTGAAVICTLGAALVVCGGLAMVWKKR